MKQKLSPYITLIFLSVGLLTIFLVRTWLAARGDPPRLNDLFTAVTLAGCLGVLIFGFRCLRGRDWAAAVILGIVVGTSMSVATLYTPYPFFGIVGDSLGQAYIRGLSTALAALGGLVILRQGGPVQLRVANQEWRALGHSFILGLGIGLPLAALNILALGITSGQSIDWKNPWAAVLDALQPGIVEEVIYRFAFLGLLWLALRKPLPDQASWLAGLLALVVHNFMHFDELFLQAPWVALGMGLVMAIVWGLPPTLLALRRDLESAITFHWIQDVARFWGGF